MRQGRTGKAAVRDPDAPRVAGKIFEKDLPAPYCLSRCLRRWIMPEKRTPRKRFPIQDEKTIAEWLLKDYHPIPNPMYHGSANWAKQVLGFDVYTRVPIDEKAFGDFIKDRGFREGKDIEWYAAAILRQYALILRHYVDTPVSRLGRLEKEFDRLIIQVLKRRDIDKSAQKGGGGRDAAANGKPERSMRVKATRSKRK
jgi:hypothetical protein